MKSTAENTRHPTLHQQVWDLLPWYVNRTLSAQETLEVQNHLAECPSCRAGLIRCRATAEVVRDDDELAWLPTAQQFDALLARVEATERSPVPALWNRLWQTLTAAWEPLRRAPRPARWVLAGQSALLLLAGGLIVLQFAAAPGAPYQTLSIPAQPASDTVRVNAVFAADFSIGELQRLLLGLEAGIVRGPSGQGVYTLARAAGSDTAAAQTQLLKGLRAHPKVLLAEPALPEAKP
jgi:hypothetical protein